ncbi:MAG: choice-of-anchor B family protein [Bacteroidetes bacterium]|nr:choice-of-anchor B family protein [Bacteroidota bacterium]
MIITVSGHTAIVSAPGTFLGKGSTRIATLNSETGEWAVSDPLKTGKEVILLSSGAADCTEGVAGQFDCGNIDLLSYMTIEDLGGSPGVTANDLWGWVDPETSREYAVIGRSNGTAFVDVTNPTNPVFIGDLPLTEGANPSSWRDIKIYANHAFIVADNAGAHGMQIFDLTHLRGDHDSPVSFSADAHYDGVASSHNIVINEDTGYAYIVGSGDGGTTCGGGLHMLNIQDPLSPEFVGCFADVSTGRQGTGYSHDAQCVIYEGPDSDYQGREICFNSNETALSISDVTDKENPVAVSVADYPNYAYTHQGWLTEDFEYFYMNDELDELNQKVVGTRTLIWDVSDLDDPLLVKEFTSENLSSDHNLYIQGDLMYQSNYRSGLRIFDISDRLNPVEIGFFDTYPAGADKPGFDGSWSNYPFFPSGTIIVSGIGEGLFVLKKQDIDI